MSSRTATFTGFIAILLWSTLALFTAMSGPVPAFQTVAMTFLIGGLLILGVAALRGRLHLARPTAGSLALGVFGPFGDTALYFAALKLAPPAEANLVHYLWPLLIVLFATLLPGGKLKPAHVIGAGIGLAATALLVGGKFGSATGSNAMIGYGFARWALSSGRPIRCCRAVSPRFRARVLASIRWSVPHWHLSAIWPSRRRSGRAISPNGPALSALVLAASALPSWSGISA